MKLERKGEIKMSKVIALTGNQAAAFAMRQIEPDVVAAYPITPQTEIVMTFAQFVADGRVATEMIPVESEHSALSACVGASASGARTMTATSSQGLALMWEIAYIAAATRLPIVMPVVNRTLSAPINIHCDHSDTMGARDSGWIQIYCENNQEVYENIIMAVRIAEHEEILLPVMVCQDGFITSHAVEGVRIYDDRKVKDFIGEYKIPHSLLDVDNPVTYGPLDLPDYYFEHKRQESFAIKNSLQAIPQVFSEFKKHFGVEYDFIETYRLDDADVAIVALSSTAGTTKVVVDELRREGKKVGLLKPRFFRPFPKEKIVQALKGLGACAILDRSESLSGQGGPLFIEIRSILLDESRKPLTLNYIYGLGGRDINTEEIKAVYRDLENIVREKKVRNLVNYLGVR